MRTIFSKKKIRKYKRVIHKKKCKPNKNRNKKKNMNKKKYKYKNSWIK